MNHDPSRTIVIVGGVAGGASAAARARRCNETARIIIFEKDAHISFANCGLPYYIGGEIEQRQELLVASPELFRDRFNVEVHTHHEVTTIDRAAQTLEVRDGETGASFTQSYDRLILAVGASPIVPPISGADAPNVFTLRNLEDTDKIKACIDKGKPRRAVVVGAGFIGLEMVEQLHRRGIETALVELADQVLAPLDPEMAHLIQEALEQHSVELHLGDGLKALSVTKGLARRVELSSGAVLDADLVILGIGVRPNTKLANDAGLALGPMGGVTVDEYMRTSDPAIYAVGDVVEVQHGVVGGPVRVPLAGPANRAGRIAGQHAASDTSPAMAPVLGTAVVRVFDRTAATTGLSVKHARKLGRPARAAIILAKHHAGYYPGGQVMTLKLIYDPTSAKVLGAQAVGGEGVDKRIDVIATAIHFGATVRDLAGLDLAYAPPFGSAKDPVHVAAFVACNDLDGLSPLCQVDEELAERQVVDVRSEQEVSRMHLRGAHHIPVDQLRNRLGELDPALPTVTVCHSGQRAHVAARILRQHGFGNVTDLTGGMFMRQRAKPDDVVR